MQNAYLRWSESIDDLISDELGRDLFTEYLKQTHSDTDVKLLMLYMVLICLPKCNGEEQLKKMLLCTYNEYFKTKKLNIKSDLINKKLCKSLEQNKYDYDLFETAKLEIKNYLELNFYGKFLKSKIYLSTLQLLQRNKCKQKIFNTNLTNAQQFQILMELLKQNESDHHEFRKPRQLSTLKLNDSTSSKKSATFKQQKSTSSMPAFPYDKVSRVIPVSAQNSEIQSISSDASKHDNDKTISSTTSSSQQKKYHKLYKQMKENAQLNKNVDHMMPHVQIPRNETIDSKSQPPLSERDPCKFAQLVSEKLERVLLNQELPKVQKVDDDDAERMIDEHVNRVFNRALCISEKIVNENAATHSPKLLNRSVMQKTAIHNNTLNMTAGTFLNKSQVQNCKEVDIDDQKSKRDVNYDSGVSMRSVSSIERVSDWLASSTSSSTTTTTTTSQPKISSQPPPVIIPSSIKTTVAYYLPGESLAYITQYSGKELTLAQFKQILTKKGPFRYFFKTKSDLLDEECVVFQEVTDDHSIVPMFNDKVISKIEKSNEI